jgi:hypothetical protein
MGWELAPTPYLMGVTPFHRRILLSVFLLILGCGLFELRESEDPSPGGGDWVFPDSAYKVLDNLTSAVNAFNLVNYLSCLDTVDFEFVADEALRSGPTGHLYMDWGYDREQEATDELFSALDYGAQVPIFLLIFYSPADSGPSTYRYTASYELSVSFSDGRAVFAAGSSDFHLNRNPSGLWSLERWMDFRMDSLTPSWAEVKAGDF